MIAVAASFLQPGFLSLHLSTNAGKSEVALSASATLQSLFSHLLPYKYISRVLIWFNCGFGRF